MTETRAGDLREPPVSGVDEIDGSVVVRLRGELDLYNADEVRTVLVDAAARRPARLVVDLEHVEFIDSTALGVLIETRSRLQNRRSFLLAAAGVETRRALDVSGITRAVGVHDSVDAALAAPV